MNRKHQGQSGRQNMQAQPRGARTNSQARQGYNEGMQTTPHPRNFSGNSSWEAEDSMLENARNPSQSYRDTDYDLDGSTYGAQGHYTRSMERNFSNRNEDSEFGATLNNYDSYRSPLRYDRYEDSYASRFSPARQASSSEKFGYPTNMNAWSGTEHEFSAQHPYEAARSAPIGSFREEKFHAKDWGTQPSQTGFLGKGPKGYKRSDDRIKEDVCETLSRDHRIDASDIEVNVENAMVTLSGVVNSREIKRAAEMIIENLSGVEDVKNEIRVKKNTDTWNESLHTSGSNKTSTLNASSKTASTKAPGHI